MAVDQGWFSTIGPEDHFVARHARRWGLGDAAIGLILAQVGSILGAVVVASILGVGLDSLEGRVTIWWLLVLQCFLWVGYGAWPVFVSARKGSGVVRDYGWRFSWHDVYQGGLVGVATQIVGVTAVFLFLFLVFGEWDLGESARELSDLASSPVEQVVFALIVAVGAPIVEELFFRGLLLRSLELRWGSKVAVVVSSLVFAAIHFEPRLLPGHITFGLMAGWLTVRSGRLGPAIWAHVGFNAVVVVGFLVAS